MLEIIDAHKAYGDIRALDGCDLRVEPGRMLGFLGPNGAGKTTAMRAVFGLVRLDHGQVRWREEAITVRHRLRFGYMPEQRGLYPKMRSRDQLVYLARLHGLDKAAAVTEADRWLTSLGIADRGGDPTEALSHGNQQRVQLAAALVHEPELVVLDEPFSGLDPLGVEAMAGILQERARQGAAVVFSSHQLDLVEDLCEDVAIIHRGRIVLSGVVRELKDRSPYRVLEIEYQGIDRNPAERLEGVVRSSFDGHRHRLVIAADADPHALLAELELGGTVRHFTYTPPSLSDLFREAVT